MAETNKIQLFINLLKRPLCSSSSPLKSQSGQAVTEYILVLVVVVGIIMGILYQFNDAFKKYVQSYFGEYVACLLETGELPGLGGEDGANAQICNASFEPFSLQNGRPLISSDSSGGSSGENRDRDNSASSRGRSGDPASLSRSRNSRLRSKSVNPTLSTRNADSTQANESASKKGSLTKRTVRRYDIGPSMNSRTNRKISQGQIPVSQRFKMLNAKKETRSFAANISNKGAKGGSELRAKKILFDPSKFRKVASETSTDIEISFGDYLRYIIILALIVMIVVFFGGQLFQLKKGWEN